MKYHLKTNGEPGKCTASLRDCPRGGAADHYTTPEAAREAFESKNEIFKNKDEAKPTLESIKNKVTDEDIAFGYEKANSALSAGKEDTRWTALMGDKRRTKNSILEYEKLRRDMIDENTFYSSEKNHWAHLHASNLSYARAHKSGVEIPSEIKEDFEEIWRNPNDLHGEHRTKSKLENNRELLGQLERGEIQPRRIIGSPSVYTNPKKVAKEYLEGEIARREEEIATRGRSNEENIRRINRKIDFRALNQETQHSNSKKSYSRVENYDVLSTHDLDELPSYVGENSGIYDRKNDEWLDSTNIVLINKKSANEISDPDQLAEYAYDSGDKLAANVKGIEKDDYTQSGEYVAVSLDSGKVYDPSDLLVGSTDGETASDYYEILDNTNGARDKWIEEQAIPVVSRNSIRSEA